MERAREKRPATVKSAGSAGVRRTVARAKRRRAVAVQSEHVCVACNRQPLMFGCRDRNGERSDSTRTGVTSTGPECT